MNLFDVIKVKDKDAKNDENFAEDVEVPEEILDEEAPEIGKEIEVPSPAPPVDSEFKSMIEEKIERTNTRIDQLDASLSSVRHMVEETNEKIERIEENIREIMTMYEIITNKMNPFVEEPTIGEELEVKEENIEEPFKEELPQKAAIFERVESVDEPLKISDIKGDFKSRMALTRWVEHLLSKVGIDGLQDLLEFYEEVGWIEPEVSDLILTYAKGMDTEKYKGKKEWKLDAEDHIVSLRFIRRLKGDKSVGV